MTDTAVAPMTLAGAITTVFSKYAEFTGRARRPEFWWFVLFTTLVSTALGMLNLATPDGTISTGSSLAGLWSIAGLIILIVRFCEPSAPEAGAEVTR